MLYSQIEDSQSSIVFCDLERYERLLPHLPELKSKGLKDVVIFDVAGVKAPAGTHSYTELLEAFANHNEYPTVTPPINWAGELRIAALRVSQETDVVGRQRNR